MGREIRNYSVNGWIERQIMPPGAPEGTRIFDKKLGEKEELVVTCAGDFSQIGVLHHTNDPTEVCAECGEQADPEVRKIVARGETVKHHSASAGDHVYRPRLVGGRLPTFPEVLEIVNHFGSRKALYATLYAVGVQGTPEDGRFPPDNAIAVQQIGEGHMVEREPLIKLAH